MNEQTPAPGQSLPDAPGATVALVLGIIGLFLAGMILGIIALVMGIKAKKAITENPGMYGGSGKATAGIVLGIIAIVGWGIGLIFWAL